MNEDENENQPTVRIQIKDDYKDPMITMARSLKQSGNSDLAEIILQDKARMEKNVPKLIEKLGNQEVSDAVDLIREREYHSKSGYRGNGNLEKSIKKKISD